MTLPDATSSPQALLWNAFRTNPASDEDLYLPDTHIVFLPTGAGAAGESHVRDFYKAGGFSHSKKLAVEETVIHRTVGESSAVDEVEVTVKFVSGSGGWLLPSVEPHHLEDLTITFPLVICGSIVNDRIASVRYVWDNASVLKMVRLIGSRHSWPIVAETQVDALRNPTRFRLNPFGNATSTAGNRNQISNISNIFSPPVSPAQISAAQQQQQKKGHPALTSQIFSQQQHQPQATSPPASAGQSGKKGHPALTSTLFDHLKNTPREDQSQLKNINRLPLSPSTSEESLASKATSPSSSQNKTNIPAGKKGHPALTSTLFNHLKDAEFDQYGDRERNNSNRNRDRALSGGNDDTAQQVHAMTSAPAPAGKKGHPALTSTLFNHLKDPQQQQPAPRVTRQEQQQQQEIDQELPAGWRSDYVKPKGHPALTSSIFSQAPPPANPALSRPYKKTSHNIFGPPPVEKSAPVAVAVAAAVATEEYSLEPSALEAELERNEEQQQELKESIMNPSDLTTEDLEKQVLELEKLKIQEEQFQAQQALDAAAAAQKSEPAVAEPTPAPAPAPVSAGRRIHPNYRSSFTIGGSR
ncbi:hypothetical protein K457DRAFT_29128 [Linnemannia elongata AG-77]|uniref:Uncharacterized protein n=1 Tax=Linnemannia elongata AG-77 TaxID=1314771 RepID=A0A197KBD8_9FUNG|nr:hypothetical protein K457DRAFT_29128 [Linnemannia elongata AG-77]